MINGKNKISKKKQYSFYFLFIWLEIFIIFFHTFPSSNLCFVCCLNIRSRNFCADKVPIWDWVFVCVCECQHGLLFWRWIIIIFLFCCFASQSHTWFDLSYSRAMTQIFMTGFWLWCWSCIMNWMKIYILSSAALCFYWSLLVTIISVNW